MMNTTDWRRGIAALSVLFLLAGCGGGGGGSPAGTEPDPDPTPPPSSSAKTGTVGIMFTDGPTDRFDKFLAEIREIRLLGDSGDVTIFSIPDGEPAEVVDFLQLGSFNELFTVAEDVPAGDYDKIRLILDDLTIVDLDTDPVEEYSVKLPGNGKVDLNPRGTFFVTPGSTLLVEIDVDAKKSLKVVETGNGEKFQFRPVVFVKISDEGSMEPGTKLTRIFGSVDSVSDTEDSFVLCQQGRASDDSDDDSDSDRGGDDSDNNKCVTVLASGETGIFGTDGTPALFGDIVVGEPLTAIGRLRASDETPADDGDTDGDSDTDTDSDTDNGSGNGGDDNGDSDSDTDGSEDSADSDSDTDSDSDSSFDDDDLILEAYVIELGDMGTFERLNGEITEDINVDDEFGLAIAPGQGFGDDTVLTGLYQDGTGVFTKAGERLTREDLLRGQIGHFEGVIALSNDEPDALRTSFIVLDPDAAVGETITGIIQSVDTEADQFILTTAETGDRQVCVDDDTTITLVTLTDEGSESAEAGLGDLEAGLDAEVFGAEGTDGCFEAETVRAEDDQRTPSTNTPPIADAGPDDSVAVGVAYMLDGTGSSDPDGDMLTYSWSLQVPEGSAASLDDATLADPSFTPDVAGDYIAELVVNDGTEDSAPDSVTITATDGSTGGGSEAPDGEALYAANCAEACHGALAETDVGGATADEIEAAIDGNRGGMGTEALQALTREEIEAIASVL
ncbi:DUF4382 domain-containing protein [Lentisalinibacter sediminis]|uniref:DUF4382 domain-containing protein n=1 Tax=Lentisalinibacter sediminis TaxID=2992237 RepID=UPI0038684D8B